MTGVTVRHMAGELVRAAGGNWVVDAYKDHRSYERRRDRQDMANLRLLIRWTLGRDGCAVDIGANVGAVLADIVDAAPRGRHYAFEPVPAMAARLRAAFPGVTV